MNITTKDKSNGGSITIETAVYDNLIKNFYSYDNKEISEYLPENVVLGLNQDGLYTIYRVNKEGLKNANNKKQTKLIETNI